MTHYHPVLKNETRSTRLSFQKYTIHKHWYSTVRLLSSSMFLIILMWHSETEVWNYFYLIRQEVLQFCRQYTLYRSPIELLH